MARFNLNDYETVEERIKRFYEANEDGRITTENLTTEADRATGTWIVKASVYLTSGDQANDLPKATGLAFEVDGHRANRRLIIWLKQKPRLTSKQYDWSMHWRKPLARVN